MKKKDKKDGPFNGLDLGVMADVSKALKEASDRQEAQRKEEARRLAEEAKRKREAELAQKKEAISTDFEAGDDRVFEEMMAGVEKMKGPKRVGAASPSFKKSTFGQELPIRYKGGKGFKDIVGEWSSDETEDDWMLSSNLGLDGATFRKLQKGQLPYEDMLDLHGKTREQSIRLTEQFIHHSRHRRFRCVLIIHGRGLNSENQVPILKTEILNWLRRGAVAPSILAFAQALPRHGGEGASYVYLKKI